MSKELKDFLKEFFGIVILALILSLVIRTWVVEGRIIPSESMEPTIQVQDRVMVNKFVYRFKDPQPGDIIVFRPPDVVKSKSDFIKRVVAIPGDKVEVKDGQLLVNDQVRKEPYLKEEIYYDFGPVVVPENSYFVMGDNRNHSYDSHAWGAWLTRDHLVGKAFCIYWPVGRIQPLER